MKEERKEEIANYINRNCRKSACLMCRQADLYKKYTDCPYLKLKTKSMTLNRQLTADDIPSDFKE